MDGQPRSSVDGRGGAGGVDDGCRAASLMGDRASAVSRCGGEGGVTEGSRRLLLQGKREGPSGTTRPARPNLPPAALFLRPLRLGDVPVDPRKRQLSPFISRIVQRCVKRSSNAAVIRSPWDTVVHSSKGWWLVTR